MQTIVRLIVGFVTHTLGQKAPTTTAVTVDTSASDEAWWQEQLKEIEEAHYQQLGDWWSEEVPSKCISCSQELRLMRWQQSGYGDECDKCIAVQKERYEDFLAACEAESN